jgi:hypothetical protein
MIPPYGGMDGAAAVRLLLYYPHFNSSVEFVTPLVNL